MTAYTAIKSLRCDQVTDVHLIKRPRKAFKIDFRWSILRKLVRFWFNYNDFEALESDRSGSDRFRSKFHSMTSKIIKIPGFNLIMDPYDMDHISCWPVNVFSLDSAFQNFMKKVDKIYNFEEASGFIKYLIVNHVSTNVFSFSRHQIFL